MNSREFLTLANSLAVATPHNKAGCRSAISRAYYAAFNVAVDFLRTHARVVPVSRDSHSAVKFSFLESGEQARPIGVLLDGLREDRNQADYEMGNLKPEQTKNAKSSCLKAQEIIQSIEQIESSADCAAVAAAVQSWAATILGKKHLLPA